MAEIKRNEVFTDEQSEREALIAAVAEKRARDLRQVMQDFPTVEGAWMEIISLREYVKRLERK